MTIMGFFRRPVASSVLVVVVLVLGIVPPRVESFLAGGVATAVARNALLDANSAAIRKMSSTCLFGKKKKNMGGGGQQQQEKKSVKEARFDASTRQFMFTLSRLTKILPDKSKMILDDINLSFYPGAKIGIVGLNGSGYVRS